MNKLNLIRAALKAKDEIQIGDPEKAETYLEMLLDDLRQLPDEVELKCPNCDSDEFDDSDGVRDYEGDEEYWQSMNCNKCENEVIATYQARLHKVEMAS